MQNIIWPYQGPQLSNHFNLDFLLYLQSWIYVVHWSYAGPEGLLSYEKGRKSTGCFIWKITKVKGCSLETVHIWPYVGKAKMRLRDSRLFQLSKICVHLFSCLFTFFLQINYRLSNTFWLYQHRVKYAPFLSHSLLLL